nr:hypothetical protein [Tanacetum cinerariifolium]
MDLMISIGQTNTLIEYMILSGADNHPPMLDNDLYDSWKNRMELYMQNREHGRMILESVEHDPLIWPTIEENGVTRTKKYAKLSAAEKIQLINDINIYKMKFEQFQVNTKFLNSLPPELRKFVTDVKLVKDFHATNFDQLHEYLQQHKLHVNEVRIMRKCNHDPLALVTNHQQTPSHFNTYQSSYNNPQFQQQFSPSPSLQYRSIHPTQHYSTTHPSTALAISYPSTSYSNAYTSSVHQDAYPQPQSSLAVPVFKQGDNPIDSINKMMSFLSTVIKSHFPSTNNQLRNSSNPRQQATIHDGRVTVQPVQGRQTSFDAGMSGTRTNVSGTGGIIQRKRDATWFRDKVLLVEAHKNGKVLNEEELEFLADHGIEEGLVTQMVITHNAAYQVDDLDAYDSDCDDFSIAKAVLMANLSSYELDVLFEDTNSSTQQDAMILYVFEKLSNQVINCNKVNKDNLIASESLSAELEIHKEQVVECVETVMPIASVKDKAQRRLKEVKKDNGAPIIEYWNSDDEDESVPQPKIEKKIVKPSVAKDETSGILKSFITRIENLIDHKVKVIICDNRTEFKNRDMNQFCEMKEAISTACYVQNRVLVVKPHNKTLYELLHYKTPMLSFMRSFGCLVTILNTIDHLRNLDGKAREGFFIGYSLNSKALRVFNSRTRILEHIRFSKNTPNNVSSGPHWLFDIDALTKTINYQLVVAGTQTNGNAGIKDDNNAGQARKEKEPSKCYLLLPLWTADLPFPQEPKNSQDVGFKSSNDVGKKVNEGPRQENECKDQEEKDIVNSTNRVNVVSSTVNAASNKVNDVGIKSSIKLPDDPNMPELEDISIFEYSNEDVFGAEADLNNLEFTFQVSHIPTTRIHKDHPFDQVIGDLHLVPQTREMSKNLEEHGLVSTVNQRTNYKTFKFVYLLVSYHKWNLKGIEAIRLFLAYASFKDFVVYQIDVKSAFLYGKTEEEVYVCQPLGFEDPSFPEKVYKVEKELCTSFKKLMHEKFQMSSMGELTFFLRLQVKQKEDGIFISQDKYVAEILKMFRFSVKTASNPMETQKPLLKDEDGEEVDVHIYRYQVNPKVSHLHAVKRIFRYLKGQPKLGHWYLKDSPFDLMAYIDSDYAGASFIESLQQEVVNFLGKLTTARVNVVQGRFIQTFLDKQLDGLPTHKEKYDVSFHTKKVFANMKRIGKGFSGKETLLFPTMKAFDLEDELKKTKTAQQTKIDGLERRVKKLEKQHRSRTHKLKRLYKVGLASRVISSSDDEALDKEDTSKQERIDEIDADEDIALVSTHGDVTHDDVIVQDEGMEDVDEEVVKVFTTAKMIIDTVVDVAHVTTAIVDIPVSAAKTIVTSAPTITAESTKINVEAKLIEEPEVPKKRKHLIRGDEELAKQLQAEIDEENRIAREKVQQVEEVNLTWNDVQAKIKVDYQLVQRLQAEEQEQLIDAEKEKLFMEFLEKRRKIFAAKRAKEKRNGPPTKA